MENRRQAEALFRYSLIRELADPELRPRRRGVMTRALAELEHVRDDGRRVRVSPATLRRWLRYWRAGGYDALLPGEKLQPNRTPAEILEAAVTLKREAPDRTAAMVARILEEAGVGKVSAADKYPQFSRSLRSIIRVRFVVSPCREPKALTFHTNRESMRSRVERSSGPRDYGAGNGMQERRC